MKKIYWIPIIIAVMTGLFFYIASKQHASFSGTHPLLGKKVPEVSFSTLKGEPLNPQSLQGKPSLVVFFSTWCPSCHLMKPVLKDLPLPVHGVLYRDKAFKERQSPFDMEIFDKLALDPEGEKSILWGIRGVPEIFLVDSEGVIRWHHRGAMTKEKFDEEVQPLLWKDDMQESSSHAQEPTKSL